MTSELAEAILGAAALVLITVALVIAMRKW